MHQIGASECNLFIADRALLIGETVD
ncbi:hypothetical protein SKA34_00645 [Photobacterium sp. SKA34]|nr:hypothetical protein SKA34_00645 [Photobacterium sp. SKA34]